MNYRGFGAAWLLLWLGLSATPVLSAPLVLGELNLEPNAIWQRAHAEEEAELASVILRAAEPDLEIYVPLQRARLKADTARFYEQLDLSWRRRYGEQLHLDWLNSCGKRWRVGRRPDRSGAGHVFHVVTVHGGEAYQLIVMTSSTAASLPDAVVTLLDRGVWSVMAPPATAAAQAALAPEPVPAAAAAVAVPAKMPEPVPAPVVVAEASTPPPVPIVAQTATDTSGRGADSVALVPAPPVLPAVVVAPPPVPPPPVSDAPVLPATPPLQEEALPAVSAGRAGEMVADSVEVKGRKWRLLRQVAVQPGAADWIKLARIETSRLGADGLIKGLGSAGVANGLVGFLEGLAWHQESNGVNARKPFKRGWGVLWPDLPGRWQGGDNLSLELQFIAESEGVPFDGDLAATFRLTPVCAPRMTIVNWLYELEKRGAKPGAGLDRMAAMACAGAKEELPPVTMRVARAEFSAAANRRVTRHLAVPMPVEWEQAVSGELGQSRRLVLSATFERTPKGNTAGAALVPEAVVLFVYGPDV